MAVQFSGGTEYLSRSGAPSGDSFTLAGWVRLDDDTPSSSLFGFMAGTLDAGLAFATWEWDGKTITRDNFVFPANLLDATLDTWVYLSLTSSDSFSWFRYSLDGETWEDQVGGGAFALDSAWNLLVGNRSDGSRQATASVAHLRVWSAVLNDTQLLAEAASPTAVVTSDLWGAWEFESDADDDSGNGRHLSTTGTVSYVDGPHGGGGPVTFDVGLPADTHAALATASTKAATAGLPGDAHAALSVTRAKTLTAGLPGDAHSAHTVVRTKAATAGLAGDTHAALAPVKTKSYTLGLPVDTHAALAAVKTKASTGGLPTETATPFAVTATESVTAGLPSDTHTALAVVVDSATSAVLGLPTDTHTTLAPASAKSYTLGLPTDTTATFPATASTTYTAGLPSEVAAPLTASATESLTFGLPTELATALPLGGYVGELVPVIVTLAGRRERSTARTRREPAITARREHTRARTRRETP